MKIFWGKKWAEAYVDFASGEKRDWLYKMGLRTDLSGRVLDTAGNPVPGLYAAGEVCGFGGGGVDGYRALEGTFLGGCLFTKTKSGKPLF
jgi:predicted oxidoreductase